MYYGCSLSWHNAGKVWAFVVGDSIVPSCRRASTYPYDVQVAGCWVNILLNSFLEMTTTGGYLIVYSLVAGCFGGFVSGFVSFYADIVRNPV